MRKISLENVNTKHFTNLIKRSASMDKLIFITVKGSEFESISYNQHSTALKSVESDFEKICENYTNECGDELVKIQFGDANKLISVLSLIGSENVCVTFDIMDDNFAKKVEIKNNDTSVNIACADKDAVDFLTLDDTKRAKVFEDNAFLQFSANINDSEFKYMQSLFALNKESIRVFFQKKNDELYISEVESTDENVRVELNETISRARSGEENAFVDFLNYEKMYCKKLNTVDFQNFSGCDDFLGCFNKQYFPWVDIDKSYIFEFHSNRVKISSFDEEGWIKSTVVLAPVMFA